MITCSKRYDNLPFAHRQHVHSGHCALIHGHSWAFEFEFKCDRLDQNGFVVDFGKLKFLKEWIDVTFDHALVLNESDPFQEYIVACLQQGPEWHPCTLAKITLVPNCGAEGLCEYLAKHVNDLLQQQIDLNARGVQLHSVTVFEDTKNTAKLVLP